MTFNLINNRLISLMLIVCIVFLCFALTVAPADALVTEVVLTGACAANPFVALAVAGTILVGAGLVFDNQDSLESMAAALINNSSVINTFISSLDVMQWASAEFFEFNLTQAAVDELGGWLDGLFSATEAGSTVGNVAVPTGDLFINGVDWSFLSDYIYDYDFYNNTIKSSSNPSSYFLPYNSIDFSFLPVISSSLSHVLYSLSDVFYPLDNPEYNLCLFCNVSDGVISPIRFYIGNASAGTGITGSGICLINYSSTGNYSLILQKNSDFFNLSLGSNVVTSSATAAADSTFFPQSLDNDKKLTPGIPLTVPEGLSNLVDLPASGVRNVSTDIPQTDVSSGTITGDGTGSGIFEGIGNWILNIPGIGAIARTISSIWDFLQSMFDVSQFSLNFEPLKVGLTTVFPFCIPFDFFNAVSMFSSSAADFTFDIDLETDYFTIDHTVDLTPFRIPFMFFRYIVVFWFGFILISRTRDFIKW